MDKKIAKEWADALRSGKYKQGIGYLNRKKTFCCLGVLCEILNVPRYVSDEDRPFVRYGTAADSTGFVVPLYITKRIALSYEIQSQLAVMNDCGDTFETIAAFIEKEFLP